MQRVAHLYHFQDAGIAICIRGTQDCGLVNGDLKLVAPCYVPQGLGGTDGSQLLQFPCPPRPFSPQLTFLIFAGLFHPTSACSGCMQFMG